MSVYLTGDQLRDLRKVTAITGRPRSELIREAVAAYTSKILAPSRVFSLYRSGSGPGGSIADVDEGELLRGLGEAEPSVETENDFDH